jgi:tol-pal system protein YbgF
MSRSLWAAAAAVSLLMSGCFYPAERGKQLEARVDRLQGENDSLRADLEKAQKELSEKIAQVNRAQEKLEKAAQRGDAENGVVLQKMVEDVAVLRGQLETYVHQLGDVQAKLASIQEDTDKRLTAMAGSDAVKAAEAKKKLDELERPRDPKAFLDLADSKLKSGDMVVARRLYDEFLKQWPRDSMCGEAHFGLGEAWVAEDKCRNALPEYGKVIQEFPKTRSAPQAYLRSADCFSKLKMDAEAKLALEEVVKTSPKSDAAKTAKAKLKELDNAKKKKGK